jgi:hypothetical protein
MDVPRPPKIIQFPRPTTHDFVLTDDEYQLLSEVIAPFHGPELGDLLDHATPVNGGRRIGGTDDDLYELMEAVGVEANGFLKVEEENAGHPLRSPRRGGTAAQLLAIYDKIENHLS